MTSRNRYKFLSLNSCFYLLLFSFNLSLFSQSETRTLQLVKDFVHNPEENSYASLLSTEEHFYFLNKSLLYKSDGSKLGTQLVNAPQYGVEQFAPRNLQLIEEELYFFTGSYLDSLQLWRTNGNPEGTKLFKTFEKGTINGFPSQIFQLNETLFFVLDGEGTGNELWKTDGTETGTQIVKDIVPGSQGASPNFLTPAATNDQLFFIAETPEFGEELWITDGTEIGTQMVKDIVAGLESARPKYLHIFQGNLFFVANNTLYKSDGTEEGTMTLRSERFQFFRENSFFEFDNKLFFVADDGVNGAEYWTTDGTKEGTVLFKDIAPGNQSSFPYSPYIVENRFYFHNQDATHGVELWISDGTAEGTRLVKDIFPGEKNSLPRDFRSLNGNIIFTAKNPDIGRQIWTTDGTSEGTKLLKAFDNSFRESFTDFFIYFKDELYFFAYGSPIETGLWKTNGTSEGTQLVQQFAPDLLSHNSPYPIVWNDKLIFTADDATQGYELWRSDGTASTTHLITNLNKTALSGSPIIIGEGTGFMYLYVYQGHLDWDLFRSDGTKEGTYQITDIGVSATGSTVIVDGILYFSGSTPEMGGELWRSDGTIEGTRLVKDIWEGSSSSRPTELTQVGKEVYFVANDPENGRELWKSDGTEGGTQLVKVIYNGTQTVRPPFNLTEANNLIFFIAFTDENGYELWRSDGTSAGTFLVKDMKPEDKSRNYKGPFFLFEYEEKLYCYSEINRNIFFFGGTIFVKTDGTEEGTEVIEQYEDRIELRTEELLIIDNQLVLATEGEKGIPLWEKEDSTSVVDITQGFQRSLNFTKVNDLLFFIGANEEAPHQGVFVSDGTKEGTIMLIAGDPVDLIANPAELTQLGDLVYFTYYNEENGAELWQTDGTVAGTRMIYDILPGTKNGRPQYLFTFEDELFFQATTGEVGVELYKLTACRLSTDDVDTTLLISASNPTILSNQAPYGTTIWSKLSGTDSSGELSVLENSTLFSGTACGTYRLLKTTTSLNCPELKDTFTINFSKNADGLACQPFVFPCDSPKNCPPNEFFQLSKSIAEDISLYNQELQRQSKVVSTLQCFPNPFSGHAQIHYQLHHPATVTLQLFDAHGRLVQSLLTQIDLPIGNHAFEVSQQNLPKGFYFLQLTENQTRSTQKVIIY